MSTVLGLFDELEPAAFALEQLGQSGRHEAADLMVLSSAPFPEGVLETAHPKSRLPLMTVICAFVGIGLGLLLAGGSAALYVLRTGGKPIESAPPIAIISYEVMMLVALTGAFVTALFEMRLPSWKSKVFDARIAEGMIGIAVRCSGDSAAENAEQIIRDAGAADVRRDNRRFD